MKLSVEFPSVSYREGPAAVMRLIKAIEEIGYDHIDIFDHVIMGYGTAARPAGPYAANMPILEALMTLSYAAALTTRVTLGTEVLVLPQRQPVLVAKQVSTLDTLSGGRMRLGIGIGWQESEYDALGEDFHTRGKRMDEAIQLMRTYWSASQVDFQGQFYQAVAMGMEPKPPQGGTLPIWIGGHSQAAYRRVGRFGDGWLASRIEDAASAQQAFDAIRRAAEDAGRDPHSIGLQSMVAPPPRDAAGKRFYATPEQVVARVAALQTMGFHWASLNATAIFQAGARSVTAIIDVLGTLRQRLRTEVG